MKNKSLLVVLLIILESCSIQSSGQNGAAGKPGENAKGTENGKNGEKGKNGENKSGSLGVKL
jgi:hypothetical protein